MKSSIFHKNPEEVLINAMRTAQLHVALGRVHFGRIRAAIFVISFSELEFTFWNKTSHLLLKFPAIKYILYRHYFLSYFFTYFLYYSSAGSYNFNSQYVPDLEKIS